MRAAPAQAEPREIPLDCKVGDSVRILGGTARWRVEKIVENSMHIVLYSGAVPFRRCVPLTSPFWEVCK